MTRRPTAVPWDRQPLKAARRPCSQSGRGSQRCWSSSSFQSSYSSSTFSSCERFVHRPLSAKTGLTLWCRLLPYGYSYPVPDRVKPSSVIFDIRALTLGTERQSARMSKITNEDLTRIIVNGCCLECIQTHVYYNPYTRLLGLVLVSVWTQPQTSTTCCTVDLILQISPLSPCRRCSLTLNFLVHIIMRHYKGNQHCTYKI